LINVLKQEGARGKFEQVYLVIGFDSRTVFVSHRDAETVGFQKLNAAVNVGGEPVGLIGCTWENGLLTAHTRPLKELFGQDWVEQYFDAIVENLISELRKEGFLAREKRDLKHSPRPAGEG
jgi:hypothetical protein